MIRWLVVSLVLILATGANLAAQEPTYTLVIKDHRFQPTEIEIPAGQKITLLVRNEDPTPEEFESHQLKREKIIPGGKEITLSIGPLKSGRYEFFGEFNPKTARGYIIAK